MAEGIRTRSAKEKEDALVCRVIERVINSDKFLDKLISSISANLESCFNTKIKELDMKVEQLVTKTADLSEENEHLEQYSRRNSLRIYGIPKNTNENTDEIVINLCRDKFNINISTDMIDCSYRLPGKEGAHSPIIVKFVSWNTKKLIYANKKKLKGSKILIKEDLTKKHAQLFTSACSLYSNKNVWTYNGKIFVKCNNSIKQIKINSDLITDAS